MFRLRPFLLLVSKFESEQRRSLCIRKSARRVLKLLQTRFGRLEISTFSSIPSHGGLEINSTLCHMLVIGELLATPAWFTCSKRATKQCPAALNRIFKNNAWLSDVAHSIVSQQWSIFKVQAISS